MDATLILFGDKDRQLHVVLVPFGVVQGPVVARADGAVVDDAVCQRARLIPHLGSVSNLK